MADTLPLDLQPGDKVRTSDGQTHEVEMVRQPHDEGIVFIYLTCCNYKLVRNRRETVEKVK